MHSPPKSQFWHTYPNKHNWNNYDNLQIPQYYIKKTQPTPPNTLVNKSTKWNIIPYPAHNDTANIYIPSIPNFEINTTQNFHLSTATTRTDGSFIPPKKVGEGHWKKEKAGYGIYNPTKPEIQISKRLPGLQTNFRAE
jgi:hypothetical protein